jgi:cytochrome P450
MTLFPQVQTKAQSEIDLYLENGRLPEFSDMESLPYVTAVMKEVLRYDIMISGASALLTPGTFKMAAS